MSTTNQKPGNPGSPQVMSIQRNDTKPLPEFMTHAWTDFEKFVEMCAQEHTIANMGHDVTDFGGSTRPEEVVKFAFNDLYQGSESDEMADATMDELRSWRSQARKDADRVRKAGLPLTLFNARLAFENKGPFAKKAKKA